MRSPEVFVRELSPEEGVRLRSISKKAEYQSKRSRAMIVLASSTGMSAPQIAGLVRSDDSHVRKVIHEFNERGFASLDPDYRDGRPKKTTPSQRDRIVSVARARPDTQGVALTRCHVAVALVDISNLDCGHACTVGRPARPRKCRAASLVHDMCHPRCGGSPYPPQARRVSVRAA